MIDRKRLSDLKSKRKLTTEALAELAGIPRGTLNKILSGETRNPTAATIARLADALGVGMSALCTEPDRIPGVSRGASLLTGAELKNQCDIVPIERRRMPILGEIAAGKPILCEETTECIAVGAPNADFALRVRGDSMIGARIHDGDLVYIRKQDDVDDGQIAAVVIDDEATLKRVYHIPGGLQLLSENPKYAPMLFTLAEHPNLRILGVATAFCSRL